MDFSQSLLMAPDHALLTKDHPGKAFKLDVAISNFPELLGHPGPHRESTEDLAKFWFRLNFQRV